MRFTAETRREENHVNIANHSFWHRMSRVLKRRTNPAAAVAAAFKPACDVYVREDGTWVFPMKLLGGAGGGASVMVGPAERVERGGADSALGNAVITSIGRSRFEIVEPGAWEVPQTAKEAGFKSHADLERGAAMLSVSRSGDMVTISAWAASEDGGYVPIPNTERACLMEPEIVGKTISDLAKLCVRREPAKSQRKSANKPSVRQNALDGDRPIPFGYKMAWIAVPATDPVRLAQLLGHDHVEPCTWEDGIRQAYDLSGVFVTPEVAGWTIAMGALPEAGTDRFTSLLERLSREFGEAFYFGTHRIVEYQAWARAANGVMRRAFAFLGERGEFLLNIGERTAEEIDLHAGVEDLESAPDENTVLALAAGWVLDPRRIEEYEAAPGPGHFAQH